MMNPRVHPCNRQLANIGGGLQRVVRGREDVIRKNATRLARRLDDRTKGRHHYKLTAALTVLDFVIDRAGHANANAPRSADAFRGRPSSSCQHHDAHVEDLGELRDVSL
ncbi:hypothetical protein M3D15_08430 [Pseudoclavibacter alba]|uniref:Transposase n=1 Tax=Pseudoclavibacter albus TaxID=272241 RepID=A0ABT2HYF7_9MICO|nr:hypothetical protein [Pseudoclavibacter alba]MCT2043354.1 hypothetical protein [Pseudoclavibacter alba]